MISQSCHDSRVSLQIVRSPQHAVRQESYQQRSSYPVYETPSYERDDDDYYTR